MSKESIAEAMVLKLIECCPNCFSRGDSEKTAEAAAKAFNTLIEKLNVSE